MENNEFVFSLILPVYGVEAYIEKCLTSCLNQADFCASKYEILLVDDETKDNSIGVANEIISRFPNHNVRILERKNGGLSAARNTGLREATGRYIWFVDSDDYISNYALAYLYEEICRDDSPEIFTFKHKTVIYSSTMPEVEKPVKSSELVVHRGFEFLQCNTFLSACTCIYQRHFLITNHFLFLEGILFEDSEFNMRVYSKAVAHRLLKGILYHYVRRPNSITSSGVSQKMVDSWFTQIDSLRVYFAKENLTIEQRIFVNERLSRTIFTLSSAIVESSEEQRKGNTKRFLSNRGLYLTILSETHSLYTLLLGRLLFSQFRLTSSVINMRVRLAILASRFYY